MKYAIMIWLGGVHRNRIIIVNCVRLCLVARIL